MRIKAGSQYDARKDVAARSVVMQIGASPGEASLRVHPVHNVCASRDIQLKSQLCPLA